RPVRVGAVLPWVAVGVLSLALVGIGMGFGPGGKSHHPDPRPGITGGTVVSAARYADYPRVNAVYAQAAEVAAVLDGLYCYCDCSNHSGHRSLLTCFESDHGAACDVCMTEASVAHQMTQDGRSLDDIRAAIDEFYGG
ncbi:MAG: CYCXC family (seleno)protein, partial [Gemmatimonadota bacterium]